jgi:iron complex transport system ATP-binding protein
MSEHDAITTQALSAGYRAHGLTTTVCSGISVTLRRGELVCLLGPNGAGKSTLMATLAGVLPALAGSVRVGTTPIEQMTVRERAQRLAIVTTERVTASGLTGQGLVALGRHPHTGWFGTLTHEDQARIDEAFALAGADMFRHRLVEELSDGERQRLMLARALAQADDVLILDELTAFLDLPRRVETMRTLRRLARDAGRAILLSTHDLDLALRSADRIWLLPRGGPLAVGLPETLVLDGAFASAFRADGVEFDVSDGSFHIADRGGRGAQVLGADPHRRWIERALVRQGWSLEGDANVVVTVDASLRWHTHDGSSSGRNEGQGLDDLLTLLGRGAS